MMNTFKDFREIENVRIGIKTSFQYCCHTRTSLAKSHRLSELSLKTSHHRRSSYITCADLDQVENRYLVVGKPSGGISIFDTEKIKENFYHDVSRVKGGSRESSFGIFSIQWYPVDSGLISTSGNDRVVKIWDSNSLKKVEEFKFECNVHHHHMSPVASSHSLMAVAGEKGEIILCDLKTGSSSHRMHGHDGFVQVVQWTRHSQYHLASGGSDGTIRLWDVRSGRSCLQIFDSRDYLGYSAKVKKRPRKNILSHSNTVMSLRFSSDGLWLLSFGCNGSLKLWNSSNGKHMNIDYGHIKTDIKHSLLMDVSHQTYPDLVFIPSRSKILTFEVPTGRLVNTMEGHLMSVLGVIFNPKTSHLYSYGIDKHFLTWVPADLIPPKRNLMEDSEFNNNYMQDRWSSDEG